LSSVNARLAPVGAAVTVGSALLLIGLLLNWWENPSAFDDPKSLPGEARFAAQMEADNPQPLNADGFAFYESRDLVWLISAIVGFGFGLTLLWIRRTPWLGAAFVAVVALVSLVLLAASLISPPDYGTLAPGERYDYDFGVDLPMSPRPGIFVALIGALGVALAASLGAVIARGTRAGMRSPSRPNPF
jgi:hypothetical protein